MNTIKMPGFTAEASLYSTSASYQSTTKVYRSGEQQVAPQFWSELWGGIKKVLSVGCRAACSYAGAQILAGCILGSEGTQTQLCAGAASLITAGCNTIC
jgi:hypothetical protein